jgi:serine/threonine-protein kinase
MDVGVQIDQYLVVEHIGRGGMADVWSARDTRLNRTVAIKTIGRDLSQSQEVDPVKLFEREAQTIAQLEHPHILPIYGFGEFQGQLYIVMRYVTGGSLEDLIADGPMPVKETLRMANSIAKALDYAHSNKVVHLDLKPSNILLDSNRSPYLADFGLATVLGPEGRAANPGYGTLLYMAPEQLTSSQIDHRADIYSFTILLFHMLTGELPFDATTSLALKQLQMQEDLPEMETVSPNMPPAITPILRKGTSLEVTNRPDSVGALVEEMEAALAGVEAPSGQLVLSGAGGEGFSGETIELSLEMTEAGPKTMAQREAEDIYNRARRAWAHGHGNFLLGVTHFMLMNDYYRNAEQNNLELDEAGMQMLLRGALEYDHEIDYWWNLLDDENRRWVALHAIRSENAPARIRAMYRLETLPDDESKQIPRLIANALQVETTEDGKRAALHVLGTRAQLIQSSGEFRIMQETKGKLLTATTRFGIQVSTPALWREVVYTAEIDLLLAQIAMDFAMPRIAELAARTIGRIRSLTAVNEIAAQQRIGTKGALRALALVRDEAPSLPPTVSAEGRLYAWLDNTYRRLTDVPLNLFLRYVFALIGGWLAVGGHVYLTYRSEAIFTPQRWANAIGFGLTYGFLIGFLVLLASECPLRLRGFWPWWARLLVGAVLGWWMATITWGAYTYLFLQQPPDWGVMQYAGAGLALGFIVSGMLPLKGWQAFLLTAIATYLPIYTTFQSFLREFTPAVLYYDFPEQVFTIGIPVALLISLGGHFMALVQDVRGLLKRLRSR